MFDKNRSYYSVRTGKNPLAAKIDLVTLKELFRYVYAALNREGYFQQDFGFECVDSGFLPGELGHNVEGALLLDLRKGNLTPIHAKVSDYSEDDLFDVIEYLYDHCSKPTERSYHSFNDCGYHCSEFDRLTGREDFRQKVNPILALYLDGYELSLEGEILKLAENGLEALFEAPIPTEDPEHIEARIEAAKRKFRRFRSTLDERRDAVRDLGDVLEYLRPALKTVFASKDEADLFNLANNFGIRHHNEHQKDGYDKPIFYDWLFYYYLATLHAALRLIERQKATTQSVQPQSDFSPRQED